MNIKTNLILDFQNNTSIYFNLLLEEDFNFKTKDININFKKQDKKIEVFFVVNCILDLKIATTALIKSLEIINKTLKI